MTRKGGEDNIQYICLMKKGGKLKAFVVMCTDCKNKWVNSSTKSWPDRWHWSCLGSRPRTAMARRVLRGSSAAPWGVATATVVAAAATPAATATSGPWSSIAWTARTIHLHTNVCSFSLEKKRNYPLSICNINKITFSLYLPEFHLKHLSM